MGWAVVWALLRCCSRHEGAEVRAHRRASNTVMHTPGCLEGGREGCSFRVTHHTADSPCKDSARVPGCTAGRSE